MEIPADIIADIGRFFHAAGTLSRKGIIAGPHYTLEIACHVCSRLYGIDLIPYRQRTGHDGILNGSQVIIRFTNCPHNRPLQVPDPGAREDRVYDELFAVLGPRCSLRPNPDNSLLVYRLTAQEVRDSTKRADGNTLEAGGDFFRERSPDKEVQLD